MFQHASLLHPAQTAAPSDKEIPFQLLLRFDWAAALAIPWYSNSCRKICKGHCENPRSYCGIGRYLRPIDPSSHSCESDIRWLLGLPWLDHIGLSLWRVWRAAREWRDHGDWVRGSRRLRGPA